MLDVTYGGAALAGLLSFLSPCILPMVPFYLSYMAGASVRELRDGGAVAARARQRMVLRALAFALGVTTIFLMLGLGATALGQAFAQWKGTLSWVAAGVLVLFGLHFLGVLRIGLLYREARVQTEAKPSTLIGAYVMGLAFGFGWTPCVGPALAAILMVASGMGELWRGGLLLVVYGLAMTLPFVLAAFFAAPFLSWVARHRAVMGHVEKAMGVMLIVFGILIATNSVNAIADWMIRNFDWTATLT
ncbi:cytochrome c biogenesis CcdA family protein [Paracoccus sp. P2]|uniref:Cytochrome C biogenesis protein CcdA n=1 Tax=Paracoccus pantotrophus TaxID=82367 RepID=A0A7H9BR48_PARPN|nr:cytochrome c biogenesis protein CcdA [Paracoccus pantotrophus]MDF3855127.1 cytochrome c biogenesis protein CcdA [Paracoccus pantotrophus]QLH13493.1 cytochrome C biogenesis protein CcdA [Paracoccus pantotrophus]RDD95785.1 cytochrome C biogenesis protein CcdA [Paracoccus pantotrophus]RNI16945.1 cytochrome C biogenesis protein CcdA [Paracoccus pantotrophus]WGR67292.1 cytochrome C biogenesis protein CcdA [Paracoccus pantotrophus]